MSTAICLYFQVHQPFRLRSDYSFFALGRDHYYEDYDLNRNILQRIAENCYIPANKILLNLLKSYRDDFSVSFSFSGVLLEQLEMFAPNALESFQELVDTGRVEILSETYFHSLASLYSVHEFIDQIELHQQKIHSLFKVRPTTFRNTELIYSNDIARIAEQLGFGLILAEGSSGNSKKYPCHYIYRPSKTSNICLALRHRALSDDIAFRFSDRTWPRYPLTAPKFAYWVHQHKLNDGCLNLFMDYETFGEHHKKESGILDFLKCFPIEILKDKNFSFKLPNELISSVKHHAQFSSETFSSWADQEQDLSAWLQNDLQKGALDFAYSLESSVKSSNRPEIVHTWRKLLTSDHIYYMSTKRNSHLNADEAIHKYFSPYRTPYDAFIAYINVLNDLKMSIDVI